MQRHFFAAMTAIGITVLASCGGSDAATPDTSTTLDTVDAVDTSAVVDEPVAAEPATYTISSGDTLSGIAARAGVSLGDLVAANGWTDGSDHLITPGDQIKLPAGASAAPAVTTKSTGNGSTPAATTASASGADTTYLDLYLKQGIVYLPFYPDAVGGDIIFAEPACNAAVADLAAFGAASSGATAASVLASLKAVNADLPANFPAALNAWQTFVADYTATYNGPFLKVGQGSRDDATLRKVLVDPAVVKMLDAYTSLDLKVPNDFVDYLSTKCTLTGA